MKKGIITTLIVVLLYSLAGCNKQHEPPTPPGNKAATRNMVPLNGTQTPGEAHNYVVNALIGLNGLNPGLMNYQDNYEVAEQITQMLISDGILASGMNADSFTHAMIEIEVDAGMIKPDSSLATPEEMFYISRNTSTNQDIQAAFDAIHNYSGDFDNYVAYAQAHLQSLSGLTTQEQRDMDAVGSILGGSYEVWAGLPLEQKANIVWETDAVIYQFWRLALMHQGVPQQIAEPIATYKSAAASYRAYQWLKDK